MASTLAPHPNIARYEECHTFKVPTIGESDFAVLQYYEEGNLNKLLGQRELGFKEIGSIMHQVLLGLEFLHDHRMEHHREGIIHRDLKPENILMLKSEKALESGGEYVPKIADFGISKRIDPSKQEHTQTLLGAYTLLYASPEQVDGGKKIRPNTDLWSFGVIAYRAFTGDLPFTMEGHDADTSGRVRLMNQQWEALPGGIEKVPEPWRAIIRRCLVADTEKRAASARECLDMLKTRDKPRVIEDAPTLIMGHCAKCKGEVPLGSRFCPQCGAKDWQATTKPPPAPRREADDKVGQKEGKKATDKYAYALGAMPFALLLFKLLKVPLGTALILYLAILLPLLYMDMGRPKRIAAITMGEWLWALGGVLVLPAYLYRRSALANDSYGPLAVLIVGLAVLAGAG
jgi:serine/threonine protein kinase